MNPLLLARNGYGSSFNEIFIHEGQLEKRPRNMYGLQKLEREKEVYRTFQKEVPQFPLAQGFQSTDTSLFLHYYKDYVPAWKLYKTLDELERTRFLRKVFDSLSHLHRKTKEVSPNEYESLLRSEIVEKCRVRYAEIKDTLDSCVFTSVNGIPCLSFEDCMKKIETFLDEFLQKKKVYTLCYIHGDPQFNNILTNKDGTEIVFIDPRGYFGSEHLYGIEEYDIAKVLFALSGYDIFDDSETLSYLLTGTNIDIPDFVLDSTYVSLYPNIHFILCSIWLANCHCFKENPTKAIVSHAYARYLTSVLLTQGC